MINKQELINLISQCDDLEELEDCLSIFPKDTTVKTDLDYEMKEEWWSEANKKYTLSQLENVLGPKDNLKNL